MHNLPDKYRKIVLIVGKTGYGKSYCVKQEILPYLDRVSVFDVMGEYDLDGFVIVETLDDYRNILKETLDKPLHVIVRLQSQSEYERAFAMSSIAQGVTVVIEEISNFASPSYMTPELERLIRFGRHTSTSVIGITQRIGDVGPLFLNNADLVIAFQLTDRNDIDRLRSIQYIGENADKVSTLTRYEKLTFFNT